MGSVFSFEARRKKKAEAAEVRRKEALVALEQERQNTDRLIRAERWFSELSETELAELAAKLPRLPRTILLASPRRRDAVFYSFLVVLLGLSGGAYFLGGLWSLPGVIALGSAWMLFRSAEKKMGYGLAFIDPMSSALVGEVYARFGDEGETANTTENNSGTRQDQNSGEGSSAEVTEEELSDTGALSFLRSSGESR